MFPSISQRGGGGNDVMLSGLLKARCCYINHHSKLNQHIETLKKHHIYAFLPLIEVELHKDKNIIISHLETNKVFVPQSSFIVPELL